MDHKCPAQDFAVVLLGRYREAPTVVDVLWATVERAAD
jgi:hypothetical protein